MKVALEIDEFSYYRYSEILSFNHSQKIGKIIPGIRVPRNIYMYMQYLYQLYSVDVHFEAIKAWFGLFYCTELQRF